MTTDSVFSQAMVASGTVVSSSSSIPAPSSSITYTVAVNSDNGPIEFAGVSPAIRQWPGDLVDTVPAPNGTPCYLVQAGPLLFMFLTESPDVGPCP